MNTWAWQWDETLFAGSAPHYGTGRMPYPAGVAVAIRDAVGLDGTGRLLDVGCGPGSLTLLLAPHFRSAVGVDADADMVAEARLTAARQRVSHIAWRHMRAEDLPGDLGLFTAVAFAQSFHWMDQPLVAARVRRMLDAGGTWIHVSATTHRGTADDDPLPHPRPPWDRIDELVAGYLGRVRRAGQGTLPTGTRSGEEDVMRSAGFTGPQRIEVTCGEIVERGLDELVSAVLSLSGSAPHLFGERLGAFETDLRQLLGTTSPLGRFAERTHPIEVVIWRP